MYGTRLFHVSFTNHTYGTQEEEEEEEEEEKKKEEEEEKL